MIAVEYAPALVEAAVLAVVGGHAAEPEFRAQRDPLYEIAEPEAREAAFAALHVRWFVCLTLDRPVHRALAERPEIPPRVARCLVARALAARTEGADLLVAPPALPTLLVQLRGETLRAPDRALTLLRRELLHVADMLDPRFGYEPRLADGRVGERYRVLWDTFVEGRLVRLGWLPGAARDERRRDFARAFPELGPEADSAFTRFFDAPGCTHADLAAFAVAHRAQAA